MTRLILEECFDDEGKYMGTIFVDTEDLTPEFIDELKKDRKDKQGWHKYREVMANAGYPIE